MNWTRKQLKQNAKATIKHNYVRIVIVCFIIALLAGGYTSATLNLEPDEGDLFNLPTLSENIKTTRDNIKGISPGIEKAGQNIKQTETAFESRINSIKDKFNLRNATEGFIANVINNSGGSKSYFVGLINTINKFVFDGRILAGTVMAITTVLMFFYWAFVQNILLVGECRFFLENKSYEDSSVSTLFFIYRIKETAHVALIMLTRFFFNLLWSLTIIGGFVKYYEYSMIPYIIAENPKVSRKQAFELSKEMMMGNKWNAFKLDLSFILWYLLSAVTFGLARIFYVNPYISTTKMELYYQLRADILQKDSPLSEIFNDKYLLAPPTGATHYPADKFSVDTEKRRDWIELDYERDYSVISYIYIFFTICLIGWLWEVFLFVFRTGSFINRGTLFGPWLPIYGTGSLLILILLKPLIKKPQIFFPSAFILCGILEYVTSWGLEKIFNQFWWDYSNMFFNINGRVCLEGLIFFAAGGGLVVYVLAPLIDEMVQKIPQKPKKIIAVVLVILFVSDVAYSFNHPNQSQGHITESGELVTIEKYQQ